MGNNQSQIDEHNRRTTERYERQRREYIEQHERKMEERLAAEHEQYRQLVEAKEKSAAAEAAKAELAAKQEAVRLELAAAKEREDLIRAEKDKVEAAYRLGLKPVVNPTKEQEEAAKKALQIDPAKCHFAICGASGSGKSSLINAFRGICSKDSGAAKTGAVETTLEITRYPDTRETTPYSRFVWYDVPGAGTLSIPGWEYFNDFGLFVFDFIVIVYSGRFTEIDTEILDNCRRFHIPAFLVRSKSDQDIQNSLNDNGSDDDDDDDDEEGDRKERLYQLVREKFIKDAREDVKRNLLQLAEGKPELAGIDKERLYIVNNSTLRALLLDENSRRKPKKVDIRNMIDEVELVKDMLSTAVIRRYEAVFPGSNVVSQEAIKEANEIARNVDVSLTALKDLGGRLEVVAAETENLGGEFIQW